MQEGGGGTSLLDVNHLPPQLAELVRQSYGDATGRIFVIAALLRPGQPDRRLVHQGGPAPPYRRQDRDPRGRPRRLSTTYARRWCFDGGAPPACMSVVRDRPATSSRGSGNRAARERRGSRLPTEISKVSRTPSQVPRKPPTIAPSGRDPVVDAAEGAADPAPHVVMGHGCLQRVQRHVEAHHREAPTNSAAAERCRPDPDRPGRQRCDRDRGREDDRAERDQSSGADQPGSAESRPGRRAARRMAPIPKARPIVPAESARFRLAKRTSSAMLIRLKKFTVVAQPRLARR